MTSPRIRPLRRDDLDIETTLRRAAAIAPEIELGWSALRQEMRDLGWPSRIPEDDRRNGSLCEPSVIDYLDSTGDLALRLGRLSDDLELLQDHWFVVTSSLRAIAKVARQHIPTGAPALPACDVTTCDGYVEPMPKGGYRNMERIAGLWVTKPGKRALCSRHRVHQDD